MPDHHENSPSDAELTAAVRDSSSSTPVDELYRRHHSAVFSYALACCRDTHTAGDLTSEVFTRTLRAVRSGGGPDTAWRPFLLTVVRRTAAEWAGTSRRAELSPDFQQWFTHAPDTPEAESSEERMLRLEDGSLVLRAFRSLPGRWQTVLWHTAVEEEPAEKVGTLLGVGADGVGSLASRAREGLREAYLTAHVESGSDTDDCRHYSSLLGAEVRRVGRRGNPDLERHLQECARCSGAIVELTGLNEQLSTLLSAGVLLWGGSSYVAARLAEAGASVAGSAGTTALPPGGDPGWRAKAKSLSIPAGAVAGSVVAAIGLTVFLVRMPGGGDDSPPIQVVKGPRETVIEQQPPVTFTATPSAPSKSKTKNPKAPRTSDGLPDSRGGLTPLHLRSNRTLGSPEPRSGSVTLARTSGNHDGAPHLPVTFVVSGVSRTYDGGSTKFDLFVDARKTIGNGQQLRVSYDLTGNGGWDRVETYRYFESDDDPGFEHYTDARGLTSNTSGRFGDLVNGKVKVEVWDAIGSGSSTVGTGDTSLIRIPFG